MKRHLFQNDYNYACTYNRATHKGGDGLAYQKHRFLLEEYIVKTVLRIGDYLVEKPVILIFQYSTEIV